SMGAYFQDLNLRGFAQWMKVQALEELTHATKFYGYVNDRGGRVILAAIDAPPSSWESPLTVFEDVLAHEQKVTGLINKLVDLAIKEKDHATNTFLQWFVTEQVEEEASANEVLQKLKLMGDAQGGLFMLDQELAQRLFAIPPGNTLISSATKA
ncbi:MAG TPA: ferritin, partial [Syntrophobacteraceae bacterium]|nr:ferritin [Syntrophobacteraceae bacterium]